MTSVKLIEGTGAPNNYIADICAATGKSVREVCMGEYFNQDEKDAQSKLMLAHEHGAVRFITRGGYLAGQLRPEETDTWLAKLESDKGPDKNLALSMREAYASKDWQHKVERFNSRQVDPVGRGSNQSSELLNVDKEGAAGAALRRLVKAGGTASLKQRADGTMTVEIELGSLDRFTREFIERNMPRISQVLMARLYPHRPIETPSRPIQTKDTSAAGHISKGIASVFDAAIDAADEASRPRSEDLSDEDYGII